MNITDIDPSKLPPVDGDMLQLMYDMQFDSEGRYRKVEGDNDFFPEFQLEDFPLDINIPKVQWFLKDASQRVIEELCEATNLLKNKQWKNSHVIADKDHFNEEMADAFKFFLRMISIVWGPDGARILFEMFRRKTAVTDFRLNTNY